MSAHLLEGVRCVELSERGSAAYAGKLLRRLGADLVKLEGPEGDPLRRAGSWGHEHDGASTTAAFDYFNDGKRTVTVEDGAQVRAAVDGADLFVVDCDLEGLERWGLAPDGLGRLGSTIVCAITPFGLSGPYARYKGPEMVMSAYGGMSIGIGEADREPLTLPLRQTAIQAGLVASTAALGALVDPGEGGSARVLDVSESDVWATIHTGTTIVSFLFSNRLRRRAGRRVPGQPYPHQLFRCEDGWIALQASERHQFTQFVEMVGSPEWLVERHYGTRLEMNIRHAGTVDELLAPWFAARTRDEVFQECRRRQIPAAPVHSVREAREDPALTERGSLESYRGASGVEVIVPAPPWRFASSSLRPPGPVPRHEGGHDAA